MTRLDFSTEKAAGTPEQKKVKAMIGLQVEIKGAVIEKEGRKIVEVNKYEVLEAEEYETPLKMEKQEHYI